MRSVLGVGAVADDAGLPGSPAPLGLLSSLATTEPVECLPETPLPYLASQSSSFLSDLRRRSMLMLSPSYRANSNSIRSIIDLLECPRMLWPASVLRCCRLRGGSALMRLSMAPPCCSMVSSTRMSALVSSLGKHPTTRFSRPRRIKHSRTVLVVVRSVVPCVRDHQSQARSNDTRRARANAQPNNGACLSMAKMGCSSCRSSAALCICIHSSNSTALLATSPCEWWSASVRTASSPLT
mmetsp:Transcript_20357/g.49517  ORF Transcript_20357/g.49517 Transcript_20357/m.49517 type:complete len:239 (+) Transcript_20357:1033-1749(+)